MTKLEDISYPIVRHCGDFDARRSLVRDFRSEFGSLIQVEWRHNDAQRISFVGHDLPYEVVVDIQFPTKRRKILRNTTFSVFFFFSILCHMKLRHTIKSIHYKLDTLTFSDGILNDVKNSTWDTHSRVYRE